MSVRFPPYMDVCFSQPESSGPVQITNSIRLALAFAITDAHVDLGRNWLEVEFMAPHRDSPRGPWIAFRFGERLSPRFMQVSPMEQADMIRRAVSRMVVHEVDEGLTLNGVRVFDPHKNDAG